MSLEIKVDLRGKISNLDLKPSDALLPLYEAVVNSIQSINERGNLAQGKITVYIHREFNITGQTELKMDKSLPPITGFTIEDNGIGFNQINYESFQTSDSVHKSDIGGKGLGHFLWLCAFESADISSIFEEDGKLYQRKFLFTLDENRLASNPESKTEVSDKEIKTRVQLKDFKEEYRRATSAYKKSSTIAEKIFQHCLSFFITETAPEIIIIDQQKEGAEKDITYLSSLYDDLRSTLHTESVEIMGKMFTVTHLRLYQASKYTHHLVYCGNNRDVLLEQLDTKLGTTNQFSDEGNKKFTYCAYVSSPYLDAHVSQDRTHFTIPEKRSTDVYGVSNLDIQSPSLQEIDDFILNNCVKKYLSKYLEDVRKLKLEMVENYVATINPQLRFILPYVSDFIDELSVGMPKEKIAGILSKHKGIIEDRLLRHSKEIIDSKGQTKIDLSSEIDKLLQDITESQKSGLVGYILYRYKLLELFQKKLEIDENGKYQLEQEIHNLILPKKKTTDEIFYTNQNLWVLDDKLAFHTYATSDIELKKFSDSKSDRRPDILIFKEDELNKKTVSSVTLIEFKRPDTIDKNILEQIYDYLDELVSRKIRTTTGRVINTTKDTVYYCYALCDFREYESVLHKIVKHNGFRAMKDNLGYYIYRDEYNAHIEILSYDKLLSDAKMRNYVWFDKLGLDTRNL